MPRLFINSVEEKPRFPNLTDNGPVGVNFKILFNKFSVFVKSKDAIVKIYAKY